MHYDYIIISPCFNENKTVIKLLETLDKAVASHDKNFLFCIVNDASTDNTLDILINFKPTSPNVSFVILDLAFNIGHQKAIYQGIKYASELDFNYAIIMDADGEDDPEVIHDLVKWDNLEIVHVARKKREEGIVFKILYLFYKMIFYLFTGKNINFGNYSLISNKVVKTLAKTSFIHFPAYLLKLKVADRKVLFADRNKRYSGSSKMKISSLITHAFKSFIEFSENILMVFLKLFLIINVILIGLLSYIFYAKFIADSAIPGWASTFSVGLVNMALICFGFFVLGIMQLNFNSRNDFHSNNSIFRVVK